MAKRVASGEALDERAVNRLSADLSAAVRRKPAQERRLAGALRALVPYSSALRESLLSAVETLVKRSSYGRPLYAAGVRALSEANDRRCSASLGRALASEDAGGLTSLSAACLSRDPELGEALARVASCRHPHLAFAAEVARVARRESNGQHVASLAPKIKESHRIQLCMEIFMPLVWSTTLPAEIAPALAVLRDAERHLGRWLVLGELATRAGDRRPLGEARSRAQEGPLSARVAWAMVAWALGGPGEPAPSQRPTVELVARLSDRPSADRDPTFLYRLAAASVATARPMLDNLVKGRALGDEGAIRAALYLVRDYERSDLRGALRDVALSAKREALRGLAVAALFDAGHRDEALELAAPLLESRHASTSAWAALVLMRAARAGNVLTEPTFRRVQLGWVE
jgi:hypothetical protein